MTLRKKIFLYFFFECQRECTPGIFSLLNVSGSAEGKNPI